MRGLPTSRKKKSAICGNSGHAGLFRLASWLPHWAEASRQLAPDRFPATGEKGEQLQQRKARRDTVERPRCEDCYFRRNMLCALDLAEPCATFRQDRPEGLVPPRQPVLLMRAPRWAGQDPSRPRPSTPTPTMQADEPVVDRDLVLQP